MIYLQMGTGRPGKLDVHEYDHSKHPIYDIVIPTKKKTTLIEK